MAVNDGSDCGHVRQHIVLRIVEDFHPIIEVVERRAVVDQQIEDRVLIVFEETYVAFCGIEPAGQRDDIALERSDRSRTVAS